ncbi:hypothetical protein H8356DRAFT_1324436 [Neocallimastix lanati (nom. inval.)]|nr:hypothetical protein H8356DRAFT_1324436 [Neocallimastix sp. JGI-2020a]
MKSYLEVEETCIGIIIQLIVNIRARQLGEMQHFNTTPLGEMQSGEMQFGEMQLSLLKITNS